jgi:V8-like Glu-specific endopeptidase
MTVLGTDDRVQVADTTAFPYSAIVQVRVDFDGDGSYDGWGTGAMISPNDVLTAGHVLWDSQYGYAKNIQVIPARDGGSTPFGTAEGTAWYVPDAYISTGGTFAYDIGVINLGTSIGSSTGTLALQATSGPDLVGTTVTTAGYPGDLSSNGSVMITTSGEIDGSIGDNRVYYNGTLDSYGGQSGSPLWVTVNGQTTIVGVHTAGGSFYNAGTALTSDFYSLIDGWTGGDINGSVVVVTSSTSGTASADVITGSTGSDTVSGYAGDDTIWGESGNGVIYGNQGADLISGQDGNDTIFGGQNQGPAGSDGIARNGTDTIQGGDGADVLYGNMGGDLVDGDSGDDILYGGQDSDTLRGGDGADRVFGNLHNDTLSGGGGNDTLLGGDGNDLLSGGSGDDLLYVDNLFSSTGSGVDTVYGGDGTDTAVYLNNQSVYSFARLSDGGVQINGYDVLYDVEYIRFADTTVTVDSLV